MEITGREAIDIIDHNHQRFDTIQNELVDVDDHGDSTREIIFEDENGLYFRFDYIQQKEWGMMIENDDVIECEQVRKVIKQITVYESINTK